MPFSVLAVPLNAVQRMVSPILGALIYAFCASKNDWPYTAPGNLSPSRSAQNPLKLSFTSILYTRPNHNLYTPDPQKNGPEAAAQTTSVRRFMSRCTVRAHPHASGTPGSREKGSEMKTIFSQQRLPHRCYPVWHWTAPRPWPAGQFLLRSDRRARLRTLYLAPHHSAPLVRPLAYLPSVFAAEPPSLPVAWSPPPQAHPCSCRKDLKLSLNRLRQPALWSVWRPLVLCLAASESPFLHPAITRRGCIYPVAPSALRTRPLGKRITDFPARSIRTRHPCGGIRSLPCPIRCC